MYRIDSDGASPNANGSGKAGFTSGDPIAPTPATVVHPDWLNAVQEEIAGVVEDAGFPLVKTNSSQLKTILPKPLRLLQRLMGTRFSQAAAEPADTACGAVTYSPTLKRFVAVGSGTSGSSVLYSNDGQTWFAGFVSGGEITQNWQSVAWSPTLNRFVAVGNVATAGLRVIYSSDGITWTNPTITPVAGWTVVKWIPELAKFVALGDGQYMTSTDGITWSGGSHGGANVVWSDLAWSPDLNLLIAVTGASTASLRSANGTSWTTATMPLATYVIAWSSDLKRFVIAPNNVVYYAPDGVNWVNVPSAGLPSMGSIRSLIWVSELSMFVAVGTPSQVSISRDGINWEIAPALNAMPTGTTIATAWSPELCTIAVVIKLAATSGSSGIYYSALAPVGNQGIGTEVQVVQGAITGWTTNSAKVIGQIGLGPGEWEVEGAVYYSGAMTATGVEAALTTQGFGLTFPTVANPGYFVGTASDAPTAASGKTIFTGRRRFLLSAPSTTVYLSGRMTYSAGTLAAGGYIRARRIK